MFSTVKHFLISSQASSLEDVLFESTYVSNALALACNGSLCTRSMFQFGKPDRWCAPESSPKPDGFIIVTFHATLGLDRHLRLAWMRLCHEAIVSVLGCEHGPIGNAVGLAVFANRSGLVSVAVWCLLFGFDLGGMGFEAEWGRMPLFLHLYIPVRLPLPSLVIAPGWIKLLARDERLEREATLEAYEEPSPLTVGLLVTPFKAVPTIGVPALVSEMVCACRVATANRALLEMALENCLCILGSVDKPLVDCDVDGWRVNGSGGLRMATRGVVQRGQLTKVGGLGVQRRQRLVVAVVVARRLLLRRTLLLLLLLLLLLGLLLLSLLLLSLLLLVLRMLRVLLLLMRIAREGREIGGLRHHLAGTKTRMWSRCAFYATEQKFSSALKSVWFGTNIHGIACSSPWRFVIRVRRIRIPARKHKGLHPEHHGQSCQCAEQQPFFRLMVYKMVPATISKCLTKHFRIQVYAINKDVSIERAESASFLPRRQEPISQVPPLYGRRLLPKLTATGSQYGPGIPHARDVVRARFAIAECISERLGFCVCLPCLELWSLCRNLLEDLPCEESCSVVCETSASSDVEGSSTLL
ncbi:hypothetical protein KCU83_g564, partial [Aureobasidium melanogenum]